MAFLGDVEEDLVPDLTRFPAMGERHSLPIEQARYWHRNRIVWAGPHETPKALESVASVLALELKSRGFETESRKFSAHVTLIRKAREPGKLPQLPAVDWLVEEFVLVRSQLSAEGRRYDVVERFPLK